MGLGGWAGTAPWMEMRLARAGPAWASLHRTALATLHLLTNRWGSSPVWKSLAMSPPRCVLRRTTQPLQWGGGGSGWWVVHSPI